MPPASPTGEEVVEKKASAPVSTACLIIACAALLGGIIFQVLEIADYRSGPTDPKDQATKRYKADITKLKTAVEDTLSKAAVGAVPEDAAPAADAPPAAPDDPAPAAPAPADAPDDPAPAEPAPAAPPATSEGADTKAAGEPPAEPEKTPDTSGDPPAEEK